MYGAHVEINQENVQQNWKIRCDISAKYELSLCDAMWEGFLNIHRGTSQIVTPLIFTQCYEYSMYGFSMFLRWVDDILQNDFYMLLWNRYATFYQIPECLEKYPGWQTRCIWWYLISTMLFRCHIKTFTGQQSSVWNCSNCANSCVTTLPTRWKQENKQNWKWGAHNSLWKLKIIYFNWTKSAYNLK